MKTLISVLAFGLIAVSTAVPVPQSYGADGHREWIAKSLKEIESVKIGVTRADLLKVFKEEGGISTRTWQRYAYRDCQYIKVDVEFEPVSEPDDKLSQSPKDKIRKISKPFLEWSISD